MLPPSPTQNAETDPEPKVTPDLFRPTWPRILFAAVVALASFFLPQEVPLEWYPLNEPGDDINYLEITCAANVTSETALYLNSGRGINELEKISWPIGPSEMAFTYTFPLADAPLFELRIDPLNAPGELLITNFRIINRRGEEIVRFTKDHLTRLHQIAFVTPTPEGWRVITAPDASDPFATIALASPIAPVGMNHRNLLRSLLSTGYLAMMLWILFLAVFFTFRRPEPWRKTVSSLCFMATLAAFFAFVGNRGLIRNSISFAEFVPPPVPPGLQLELDVVSAHGHPSVAQLFWDIGEGINQSNSLRVSYEQHEGLQTLRFPLPAQHLHALRFDPRDGAGKLSIRRIRIIDAVGHTKAELPLQALTAVQDVETFEIRDASLSITAEKASADPVLSFQQEQVDRINQLRTNGARTGE